MDKEFFDKIEGVFKDYYFTTIEEKKDGHPQFDGMERRALINIQHDFLVGEIKKRNVYFNFEKMTEAQRSVYDKALAQQLWYVLAELDFSEFSGYDIASNTFAPRGEIKIRALSPAAKATLEGGGFFYSGLNGGTAYPFRRW